MKKAIHQFLAGFNKSDAISNEAIVIQKLFRDWGYESEIFSEAKRILPELQKYAHDISEYQPNEEDIVLLHLSIGSPINDIFNEISCKKAILYHNVTPAHYFEIVEKKTSYNLAKGREQAKKLANTASINMADSKFNADELLEIGFKDVKVLPLLLDQEKLDHKPDKKILDQFDDDITNILFVGRCAPNKKIEDLLSAFHYYQKTVNPESRLIHVGSFAGVEQYYFTLLAKTSELELTNVHFAGTATQAQLTAFYKSADVFLCMSEHEGFCIPILEAMYHKTPVMAYASSAVPETMNGAGIIFQEKKFDQIAEMIERVTNDKEFRSAVLKKQEERITRYMNTDLETELKNILQPLISS